MKNCAEFFPYTYWIPHNLLFPTFFTTSSQVIKFPLQSCPIFCLCYSHNLKQFSILNIWLLHYWGEGLKLSLFFFPLMQGSALIYHFVEWKATSSDWSSLHNCCARVQQFWNNLLIRNGDWCWSNILWMVSGRVIWPRWFSSDFFPLIFLGFSPSQLFVLNFLPCLKNAKF